MPLQTTLKRMTDLSLPIPNLHKIPILTPNSPLGAIVPSIGMPFKFVLASSKTIAGWFGVTCEDCPDDSIWGCYVTKSCWKVVIVALGAIFLFITFFMGIFFLGQIDDLLKYQRQLTEFEKSYPTLAKIMIFPLKQFHKSFTKSYDKTMNLMTKKFGTKPWFKFIVIMPCKCLKGTWTIFQKVLQPTCLFTCTVCGKTKKNITDTGFFQWISDKALKKVGLRDDPKGDRKREIKAKQRARQAKIDRRKANKQTKKNELQAKKDGRAAIKQARLEAKAAKKQAKIEARKARKEAQQEDREARNDDKLDALEDAEEVKRDAKEATEEARLEAIDAIEDEKREAKEGTNMDKASKAPPSSPALPSPPSGPPPSPIPPTIMISQEMSPTKMFLPMKPPTTPHIVPSATPSTLPAIIPQQLSPPTMIPVMVPPIMPTTSFATIPLMVTNHQIMYEADPTQQYVDPYKTQQYDVLDNGNSYGGYQASTGQETQDLQRYRAYGGEQYEIYGNDPTNAQQQGIYRQDHYGQQAMEYDYDSNVAGNIANAQQQYQQQEYPQQQYNGPLYYL